MVCRQVSIWREAKGKMSCVTSPEMSKAIIAVYRLEPVIDLTVAVGCEGGRVLLLRITEDGDGDRSATSSLAKMMQTSVPSHDDKLRIVQVRHRPRTPAVCAPGPLRMQCSRMHAVHVCSACMRCMLTSPAAQLHDQVAIF